MFKSTFLRFCFAICIAAAFWAASAGGRAQSNPILPGDHPDPTIIRVGKTYWTASTAGNWAPVFALYRSTDLRHWVSAGAIFPSPPAWAESDFWAPELVEDGGRTLVYYVARKRGGGLCVGVADAATPAGPYNDHGPIVCQEDGSIDPAFVRDERGQPYLIWKEDGNSRNRPTPIWAQPLTADLLRVTGEKTQLLVNDPGSWEGGVVEAPYILRHGGQFYLFYAGNACCGVACHYAEGVARAEHLLGPWTKDPKNPVIGANAAWRCPGHGTAVQTPGGKTMFLYHAYPASGTVYLGREPVLDAVEWGADSWPSVNGGRGPGGEGAATGAAPSEVSDRFPGNTLSAEWRWPVHHQPKVTVAGGRLRVSMPPDARPETNQAFVARSLTIPTYLAEVEVVGDGGLGLIGDAQDDLVLSRRGDSVELWKADRSGERTLWTHAIKAEGPIWLRVVSTERGKAIFAYRVGEGAWTAAGGAVDLEDLLPWDSGLRVGLVVDRKSVAAAEFQRFSVGPEDAP